MTEKIANPSGKSPELGVSDIERTLWTAKTMLAEGDAESAFCELYGLAHDERVTEPHYTSRANQIMAEAALADNRLGLARTYLWRALAATSKFRRYGEYNTMHIYRASVFCSYTIGASLEGRDKDVETYLAWAHRELAQVGRDPDVERAVADLKTWLDLHSLTTDFMLHTKQVTAALVTLSTTLPSPGNSVADDDGEFLDYSPKPYLTPKEYRSPETLA